jgi:hypothetical protein
MSEKFEDINDVKEIFQKILGADVNIKDDINNTKKEIFIDIISRLEKAYDIENSLLNKNGIDISKLTDVFWLTIEDLLIMSYDEESAELIIWYIFDRIDDKGEIIPLFDNNQNEYILYNPEQLWEYMVKIYPITFIDIDVDMDDSEDE